MLVSFQPIVHADMDSNCPVSCKPHISPAESSLLHDNVAFVLCLDTLAKGDELYMHVSRPPKPDTPMHSFIQQLEEVILSLFLHEPAQMCPI